MYTYPYVHAYIYVCSHTYTYTYTCTYIHIHTYTFIGADFVCDDMIINDDRISAKLYDGSAEDKV